MDTFSHFKSKLDSAIENSVRAQIWLQEPFYTGNYLDFGNLGIWCGVTRACVVDDNFDYVVKFTYQEDNDGDPCERECNFYENAIDANLDKYFAAPKYVGRYEWHGEAYPARDIFRELNLYLESCSEEEIIEEIKECGIRKSEISIYLDLYQYPRAKDAKLWTYYPSNEIKNQVKKSNSKFARKNSNVAAYFIELYGYEEFLKVADFLEWNGINDLHGGNVGYLGEKLVFIDYAGYFGDSDSDYSSSY